MNSCCQLPLLLAFAVGDVICNVFSPSVWTRLCDKPAAPFVSGDFFGINIASSEDERCDDYVMERLRELNINQVRLAFSYCSFEGPAARFLDKLIENGFSVSLVVLPSSAEAGKMFSNSEAQEQWRKFVAEVLRRYARKVAFFEIGSTPNRKKWSGFRPWSYLRAWEIACEEARPYSVVLAGPNVQDFEPFYNAALLFAMRRTARSPEIHTNNLFVERVVEPEAYDHRVLGRWATGLLKLNLVKKARFLQFLGHRAGCRQTISTCKFWSTKRLQRWSSQPQDKKVDYLVRYLVLAATSGALARVYWGPMICWRDGLIDDRADGYPEVDHATFYHRVRGDIENLSVTPAFFALGYVARRLGGSRCDRAFSSIRGLSHFAFVGPEKEVFHVCWCRDGQAVGLKDIYSADQIARAVFTDACGKTISAPPAVNERPLFIDFPELEKQMFPARLPEMSPSDSGIIYLSLPKLQGIPWRCAAWRGAFNLRPECPNPSFGDALSPEKLPDHTELVVMRDRRNRLWNIAHPSDKERQLTVKLSRPRGLKRLTDRFKPSKGRRHWNAACIMLQRGINTPTPVAFFERPSQSSIRESYYICDYVPDAFSSRHVCHAFSQGQKEYRGLDKQQWFDFLTGFICRMHDAGVLHRDLSVGNLMLKQEEDGRITPFLIDIGRARVQKTPVDSYRRILDLIRICYKLDRRDRELFVASYEKCRGKALPSLWRLAVRYYDFKQGSKKSLKKRFRKQG
ncbi:MAG: lipopolysaccharide kinase InaA family protein [Syntrophotaleaceae bacterium]